jgi:uncharacterized protein (DUF433 family)
MALQSLDRHIESTPGVVGSKPRITGHRITVQDIAIWHQQMGKSVEEICSDHDLGPADVHAALAYYVDHWDEIDRRIAENDAFLATLRRSTPSVLERRLKELRGE